MTGRHPSDRSPEAPLEEQVRLKHRNQVAWITIDRPDTGNALTPPCRDRIRDILNSLNSGRRSRCAVITAAGDRFFCAGAELSAPRGGAGDSGGRPRGQAAPEPESDSAPRGTAGASAGAFPGVTGDVRRMMLNGQYSLFPALLDCDVPVIAAVNGAAAGMGAHLALACDLVIASDRARFVEVFARRGLVPDALGPWLLPRIIGVRRTMELFLLADALPARRALEFGLVNRVVPHDELAGAAAQWAERLASGPTRSFMLTKWLVNRSLDVDRATMIHDEAMAVELNTRTADAREGVASFLERRPAEWKGC